jgi:DNA-binding IclR family transcriptional regulator
MARGQATADREPPRRSGDERATDERAGVQSVVIAANVLKALAAGGGMLPLKELAAATRMPRGKVHRYLTSLRSAGLVAQNPETGQYYIASAAVMIGLVGLGRISPVRQLQEALPALRDRINETVTAAIWGERGPIIIAIEESDHLVSMNIRIGSALPVLTTAIGQLFLAYLPSTMTRQFIAAERKKSAPGTLASQQELGARLESIRARQLSQAHGVLIPGVDALAAPVFDHRERIIGVMCAVGHADAGITDWSGIVAPALSEAAGVVSRQLGSIARVKPMPTQDAGDFSRPVATPKQRQKGGKHEPNASARRRATDR